MSRMRFNGKKILKDSIFGQLFILWTAPIDGPKLDLSPVKKSSKVSSNWIFNNLIVGHKG